MNYFKGKGATLVNTWSSGKQYDGGVVVYYEGDYYISTKLVPRGIKITDLEYWVPTNDLSKTLDIMEGKIDTNASDIDTLESSVSNLTKKVDTLDSNLSGVESDLSSLKTSVSSNSSNISKLQSSVSTNTTNIEMLQKSVSTNTSNISSLQSSVDTISNTLEAVEETVSQNSSDIETLTDKTEENTDNYASLLSTVNLLTSNYNALQSTVEDLLYDGAGAHNSISRGKYLGSYVTDEQYEAIADGTFKDIYPEDYWTINGINWRVGHANYYYNCGDTNCTTNHLLLVPDSSLYSAVMNTEATTAGGYVGSEMYTTNLESAKETIISAFGEEHILSHRVYLTNAVTSGHPSGGGWHDSTVALMNEQMVYGGAIFMPISDGSNVFTNYRIEKSQIALFRNNPTWIAQRYTWWLRDVVSASTFAYVDSYGAASYNTASRSYGVRPAFCICAD